MNIRIHKQTFSAFQPGTYIAYMENIWDSLKAEMKVIAPPRKRDDLASWMNDVCTIMREYARTHDDALDDNGNI